MMKRYEKAKKSYDEPVIIVSQAEAEAAEKSRSKEKKTWKLYAENVRDFAFTSSRRYIMDAQAVRFPERNVMAISIYPPEMKDVNLNNIKMHLPFELNIY